MKNKGKGIPKKDYYKNSDGLWVLINKNHNYYKNSDGLWVSK